MDRRQFLQVNYEFRQFQEQCRAQRERMRFDYDKLNLEKQQVKQFRERIRQAKELLERDQTLLDQHCAFLDAHRARTKSTGLGGDPFRTSVEVPLVPTTLGGTSRADQFEREDNELREVLKTVWLPAEAKKREQQERMLELQRRGASPYIPHVRSSPILQFSQTARSTAPFEAIVAVTGGSLTAGNTLGPIRTSFPADYGRFGGQQIIPPIRLPIKLTIQSIPPVPQVSIQSDLVVSRAFEKPDGGRQERFQAPVENYNPYQSQFAPVSQSTEEFHEYIQAANRRSLAELILT